VQWQQVNADLSVAHHTTNQPPNQPTNQPTSQPTNQRYVRRPDRPNPTNNLINQPNHFWHSQGAKSHRNCGWSVLTPVILHPEGIYPSALDFTQERHE
jgi:hypothetical protein